MLYLIPLIIILFCLLGIVIIVARKFPQLSNLDVTQLPEEKETKKKKELLAQRIEKRSRSVQEVWKKRLTPLLKVWGQAQLKFRIYVGKIERLWHHEQMQKHRAAITGDTAETRRQRIDLLIQKGREHLETGAYDQAEEMFIQAVTLDQKSPGAYRGLADAYLAKGSLAEALETYRFLLQLTPRDDGAMIKFAEIQEQQGNLEQAIDWYQQAVLVNDAFSPNFFHLAELLLKVKRPDIAREAILQAVELEPKNPKYLDLLTEIAVSCRDKELALQGWNDLRLVNPENQKLDALKSRINEL